MSGVHDHEVMMGDVVNRTDNNLSFRERGGLWILAQMPVLLLAFALPIWTGSARLESRYLPQGIGIVLIVVGIALTVIGLRQLSDALTPFPRPLQNATLHNSGVYGLVRHPIYSGLVFSSFGWSLLWLSLPGVAYAAVVALFFDRKAAQEEAWLEAKYRDHYIAYKKRVKKLIPWLY